MSIVSVPPGSSRFDYAGLAPKAFAAYMAFGESLAGSSIEAPLCDLVTTRASQINGCAFCVDMHVKEATIHGERALRLHHLAVWHESNLFSKRERAALAWTEVLTRRGDGQGVDAVFEEIQGHLSEQEIADLTFLVMLINGWNIANLAVRNAPGSMDAVLGLDAATLG
ncbi:MAG: carboxymuconolactone decarboxylase family protein [Phycisphaerales bacterium]|nr:carboxymuconolactone decarboxylase family protein [Phycisphaerales bacterium]